MRIGLDLDNTLIDYDRLFFEVAAARGLIPAEFAGTKRDIRDHVRLLPGVDGEIEWQRLQAEVYGPAIAGATAADGALEFIQRARAHGAELTIVSHKTEYSNLGTERVSLRDAARTWLRAAGMLGADAVPETNLYFEDTREAKIARIVALRCTHFIDDLEEVFDDPAFPPDVRTAALQYVGRDARQPRTRVRIVRSFNEIADALIAG